MEYSLYPLGILGVKDPTHQDFTANLELDSIWKIYEGRISEVNMKVLFGEVLDFVNKQFSEIGGFNNFIETQARYGKHTLTMASFLEDTVRYIETGKRKVSIASWDFMLRQSYLHQEEPQTAFVKSDDKITKRKQYALLPSAEEPYFIAKWLSYPDGFKDMIWSLRILFGSVGAEQ